MDSEMIWMRSERYVLSSTRECQFVGGLNSDFNFQEPNLTTSRLSLLIDSLGLGAEVIASGAGDGKRAKDEMQLVLDSSAAA
jgi:hypothetical protein